MKTWYLTLIFFMISIGNTIAQPQEEKVVFKKIVATQKLLLVLEKEIPYIPSPEIIALGAKVHVGIPDHVYLYTFVLRDGKNTNVLWTTKQNYFKGSWFSSEPALKVLDATISQGKLCVLYKEIGITEANVITPGAPLDKPNIAWPDAKLIVDSDPKEILIQSGVIEGSLEKKDLTVEIVNSDKRHFKYKLQTNKWVLVEPGRETSTPAVDTSKIQDNKK